jgi:hypothetical protein
LFINDPTGLYTCLHFDQAGFQKHLLTSCFRVQLVTNWFFINKIVFLCFELWCFMIVITINFIFCPNIIYLCSVKLDFSISYKESGFKIITFINDPTGLYTCLHFDQAGFQKHLLTSCFRIWLVTNWLFLNKIIFLSKINRSSVYISVPKNDKNMDHKALCFTESMV